MATDTPPAPDLAELQDHAEQANEHLKALADGLGGVGAPDSIVKAVDEMASATGQIIDQLAGPPADEQPKATMDSATNEMQGELKSERGA